MADSGGATFDPAVLARLRGLPRGQLVTLLRGLSEAELRTLHESWAIWALPGQREPAGDWQVWLIRAGRGFGKTRAGAEWVSALARAMPGARIAMVGGTMDDVRKVMVEGESGLIAVAQAGETYRWRRDAGEFVFDSGARAFVYSAEAPEKLRGPEHHAAWCDELAKWRYGDATWDNLMMGLRIGDRPRVLVTTTPRPVPLMRRLLALPGLFESRGGTGENPFLPASFVAAMSATYAGTRLGRQELDGELIDDVEGALWTRDLLERQRGGVVPALVRVVVGVDPPAGTGGDACGIVCVALGEDGLAYVLEDASVAGLSPEGWARAVADCAARHGADRVVAECNQGGEMVRSVLMAADCALPVRLVHASRGKVARAEPVATLYEGGRVFHVGAFPALEDELCGLVSGGYVGPGRSPDRADALVWALTELCLRRRVKVGVRVV
ncbi:DNA-packaging protein [Sphingomonas aerolata]|uniref:DNA-packaging protein n=1 Tax=Sphingomonas aerolata TaxID=185951 RepID=UPI00141B5829|nr:terminase family protein [Sphingomonas aerolata]NII57317.1 phage terminase large subunit-like protein [Sphingomonas aerolata]